MIENEIYCYINGFLKWNISKKASYIVGNKKFTRKICVLNLRNKKKSIFARVIIRYYEWKKITKETGKVIIKITYRWNNGRSLGNESLEVSLCNLWVPQIRAGAEQEGWNLSYSFSLKKFVSTYVKNVVVKLDFSRLGIVCYNHIFIFSKVL